MNAVMRRFRAISRWMGISGVTPITSGARSVLLTPETSECIAQPLVHAIDGALDQAAAAREFDDYEEELLWTQRAITCAVFVRDMSVVFDADFRMGGIDMATAGDGEIAQWAVGEIQSRYMDRLENPCTCDACTARRASEAGVTPIDADDNMLLMADTSDSPSLADRDAFVAELEKLLNQLPGKRH